MMEDIQTYSFFHQHQLSMSIQRGGRMKDYKWTYGVHKFKNKEEAVKFLKDGGHSKSWINGYVMVKEEEK